VDDDFLCALGQRLSGLRDLQLYLHGLDHTCTGDGLLKLTGLQQLTRLRFDNCKLELLQEVSYVCTTGLHAVLPA
jgi:hypothetical protein